MYWKPLEKVSPSRSLFLFRRISDLIFLDIEDKVIDHNFGSLIRMNSEEEYSESNNDTILCAFRHPVSGSVTKFLAVTVCVQFLAFEVTTGVLDHGITICSRTLTIHPDCSQSPGAESQKKVRVTDGDSGRLRCREANKHTLLTNYGPDSSNVHERSRSLVTYEHPLQRLCLFVVGNEIGVVEVPV